MTARRGLGRLEGGGNPRDTGMGKCGGKQIWGQQNSKVSISDPEPELRSESRGAVPGVELRGDIFGAHEA